MINLIDFIIHIDKYLAVMIQSFGTLIYFIIFLIIFLETGLVITPFLPGDSLLFAAGALASISLLNIFLLFIISCLAAILGDSLNYFIGNYVGPKVFKENSRFFKKEYLIKTQEFYEKHGGKAIFLARFMPIIRTFAPFVAGIGKMNYFKFIFYNIFGGILWVALFLFGGYFFGQIPLIKDNFSIVLVIIILLSLSPILIEFIKHKRRKVV